MDETYYFTVSASDVLASAAAMFTKNTELYLEEFPTLNVDCLQVTLFVATCVS